MAVFPATGNISQKPASGVATPDPAVRETELQWRDRRTAELLSDTSVTDHGYDTIINTVVEINMPIADSVARRYTGRGVDGDDLTQVARLGLVQAARRFRPDTGDFHSFAIPTVSGEVKRYFRDQGWAIRPPRRLQELRHDIAVTWPHLAQEKAHMPDAGEIAARLETNRTDVAEALTEGTFRLSSLDAPTLAADDTVGEPDDGYQHIDDDAERRDLLQSVQDACQQLSDDDLAILRMRYLDGNTQATIATHFHVSQMSISRRLARIIKILRQLTAAGENPTLETTPAHHHNHHRAAA